MRKSLLFFLVITAIFCVSAVVFAEQDSCTADSFGCWVPSEGGKTYIRYWSEEARSYLEAADSAQTDLKLLSSQSNEAADAESTCQKLMVSGIEVEVCP